LSNKSGVRCVVQRVNTLFLLVLAASSEPVLVERNWSVGAGISTSTFYVDGFSVSTLQPEAQMTLERRLAGNAWLLMRGSFGYSKSEYEPLYGSRSPSEHVNASLALGFRYAFSLANILTLSPFVTVGGGYSWSEWTQPIRDANGLEIDTWNMVGYRPGVEAQAGLMIERELIPGLALRFSTPIASVRYNVGLGTTPSKSLFAGLAFAPSLELRFVF
jgi:hypothetical protein